MPFQFRKEAIEEDLNSNFPSQGQGNPPLYYSLSEVVVPTYSINSVAEGTSLPEYLQQAWDFSTSSAFARNTTATVVNTPGFWLIGFSVFFGTNVGNSGNARMLISDGISSKNLFKAEFGLGNNDSVSFFDDQFVVFLRSGDSVSITTSNTGTTMDAWSRQIADVNGNLVNPLGFSFA